MGLTKVEENAGYAVSLAEINVEPFLHVMVAFRTYMSLVSEDQKKINETITKLDYGADKACEECGKYSGNFRYCDCCASRRYREFDDPPGLLRAELRAEVWGTRKHEQKEETRESDI